MASLACASSGKKIGSRSRAGQGTNPCPFSPLESSADLGAALATCRVTLPRTAFPEAPKKAFRQCSIFRRPPSTLVALSP